jgi:hypothetical protein
MEQREADGGAMVSLVPYISVEDEKSKQQASIAGPADSKNLHDKNLGYWRQIHRTATRVLIVVDRRAVDFISGGSNAYLQAAASRDVPCAFQFSATSG